MGMQNVLPDIPNHLINFVEAVRARLRAPEFLGRHRVRGQDFTRQCQLTFPVVMLFVLQKTLRSIQRHLHELLNELAAGELFEPVTTGAFTHARAKLKHTAFVELNRECVLPAAYSAEAQRSGDRWRGHRLIGLDSSKTRLPNSQEMGEQFGWVEVSNQNGSTGTRYPEGRLSVVYDLRKRVGLDARLEPASVGEVALALEQLGHLQPGDISLTDRGYTGYVYLASVAKRGADFIARCSTSSFLTSREMFAANRANRSRVVWVMVPREQKQECLGRGLPLKMKVRFVSVRLSSGELEVLMTSLVDEQRYPTEEFLTVYGWRWGHETFHFMLKGRLELENYSGLTVEAVQQDFHAAVLLCNLESLLSEPAQAALNEGHASQRQTKRVNRSVSYHALKDQLLDLLYRDVPAAEVIEKLTRLFQGSPVAVRPDRKIPRRLKRSFPRSYHFYRRVRKIVF
jgi:hypothetical protein